ncbi:MAG: GNAT family N-acetyltransferase [Microscillaceae bacterium]
MQNLLRTHAQDPDFIQLVTYLDAELAERDGAEHHFYAPFNKIDKIPYVVVCYDGPQAVACGALRPFDKEAIEVKRMFCQPAFRGRGLARQVLAELEAWAFELGFRRCVLETGQKQPEAIQLYQKSGYQRVANYDPYIGVENSVCFEKILTS